MPSPRKHLYGRESRSEGLPLNNDQRLFWAHGLRDLSHLAAAALIFGQAFAGRFSFWLFALGLAFVVVAYVWATTSYDSSPRGEINKMDPLMFFFIGLIVFALVATLPTIIKDSRAIRANKLKKK